MIFKSREDVFEYLNDLSKVRALSLGFNGYSIGSQGQTFYDKNLHKVVKIYLQFLENEKEYYVPYEEEKVMRFKDARNDTFYFPEEIVKVNDEVIGYITGMAPGRNIDHVNPLNVNLDEITKASTVALDDVKKMSKFNIQTYDVLYNIMYGPGKVSIIDTDDYSIANNPVEVTVEKNVSIFNQAMLLFLIDGYFDEFVRSNKLLKEMYCSEDINLHDFLVSFKKYLSEQLDKEVVILNDAKTLINKKEYKPNFVRCL